MVSAITFCPSPPLLVPELAAGAAAELDPLRAACREAVRRLLAAGPAEVVVIGPGPRHGRFPAGSSGTLAGYGVPVTATLPGAPPRPAPLPLALTLGAWLLAGAEVPCWGIAVDGGPARLPDAAAYLVMGDGSARRSAKAPGYLDGRAGPFDAGVEAALRSGDPARLRDLDPVLGAELLAAGVPAWRTVGRAIAGGAADPVGAAEPGDPGTAGAGEPGDPGIAGTGEPGNPGTAGTGEPGNPGTAGTAGGPAGGGTAAAPAAYDTDLLYADAPYGVGYFVATWTAR